MKTYFISQDVCNKLNIRNATQVFNTHGLIEGRDYIKFSKKMNNAAFKQILDYNLVPSSSTIIFLLTVPGILELIFKSKTVYLRDGTHEDEIDEDGLPIPNPQKITLLKLKDQILGIHGYEIYDSMAYKAVNNVVGSMTDKKREEFYNNEPFALEYVKQKVGTMNDEMVEAIKVIRSFACGTVSMTKEIAGIDTGILTSRFKNFTM